MKLEKLPSIDFFMIDEFYKLGSGENEESRRSLLNIAWNKLKKTGAQYYLTEPNIDSLHVDVDEKLRDRLVTTDFKTVIVEMDDRSHITEHESQLADLKKFLTNEVNESNLIFVGSPKKVSDLATELDGLDPPPLVLNLAQWIDENYHREWYVGESLRRGIGVHAGPLPRSLQRAMVRLFQNESIRILICTSTITEGVNTVAKNMIVFEKKINRNNLDFFTFSNIQGRAGRMFKHFVGRVVSYYSPPNKTQTEVNIPIESQSTLAPLSTLIQLDETKLTDKSRERLAPVFDQSVLSIATIRNNPGVDPESLIKTAQDLRSFNQVKRAQFSWSGIPKTEQARAVLELGFDTLLVNGQRRGMNFEMMWGKLQAARETNGDIGSMIKKQLTYRRPVQTISDVVDEVLQFQRKWIGFTIPTMIRGIQSIQSEILPQYGEPCGNYEYFLREIEGLYMPPHIADLEEYGLPLPLTQKLIPLGLQGDSLQATLNSLLNLGRSEKVLLTLNDTERWFLDDIVDGLAHKMEIE